MWLKKQYKNRKSSLREKTFKEDLMWLLDHITIHCYGHMSERDRSGWEILMWIIIHFVNGTILIYILSTAWDGFTTNPIITTLYDTLYPISKIPFPAIAVCNNNRISKKAAEDFARELMQRDVEPDKTVDFYLQNMRYLGRLYDFDLDEENHYSTSYFQGVLEDYYSDNSTDIFSVQELMLSLTPKCSDISIRCFWQANQFECMSKNMLEVRITQYGHCCTFNYMRPEAYELPEPQSLFTDITGPDMGLILVLNGSSNDYFYPLINSFGFNIQVFDPYEIPDTAAGGVVEKVVSLGMETFLRVNGITIRTEEEVRRYSIENRECLFRDEMYQNFHGRYERGNCVINCRIKSILALCGCIPFFMPNLDGIGGPGVVTCNLQHLSCLNKYKVKWYTLVTKIQRVDGLEKEMEESLYCPDCLPSCSNVQYLVTQSELPLVVSKRSGYGITTGLANVTDVSVIRLFFGQPDSWLYKQDVALFWYEILSNFGGMFGILAGFSIMSGCEIIYFILKQTWLFIRDHLQLENLKTKKLKIYP